MIKSDIRVVCCTGIAALDPGPGFLTALGIKVRFASDIPDDLRDDNVLFVVNPKGDAFGRAMRLAESGGVVVIAPPGTTSDGIVITDLNNNGLLHARTLGEHWISQRVEPFRTSAGLCLIEAGAEWTPIMGVEWRGKVAPSLVSRARGPGRAVILGIGSAGGIDAETERLLIRAIRWAAGRDAAQPHRLGVIGYGGSFNMGKVHADQIRATTGLELTAICDADPMRLAQAQSDFPNVPVFATVAEMLAAKVCDSAAIVVPHNAHAPVARQCLDAGVGVVSEKPFCLSVAEADDLIARAKAANALLTVYHNRRLDPDFVTILGLVRSGAIGDIFESTCGMSWLRHPGHWWRSDKRISGGNLFDWGAHMIDWTLLVMNRRIDWVQGFFAKSRWHDVTNEDHTQAVIRFTDGSRGDIFFSYLAAAPRSAWMINGTRGAIVEEKLAQGHVTLYSDRAGQVPDAMGDLPQAGPHSFSPSTSLAFPAEGDVVETRVPHGKPAWHLYYANLADHLIHREPLLVPAKDARRIIAVIETAEKSAAAGKPMAVPGE